MITSNLQQVHTWLKNSQLFLGEGITAASIRFEGVSTDSRKIQKHHLFLALKGDSFDAHDFLDRAQESGASCLIIENVPPRLVGKIHLPYLIVPSSKQALLEIAENWRKQFTIPVIGVTGSNGKTTVKEMIASILKAHFGNDKVLSTQGNLNNDIGVPLTLFQMGAHHQAAVIEMGMNHPGEILCLAKAAQPTVALVNNAQREHQEFMKTVEAVAYENGEVFKYLHKDGVAVFPLEDAYQSVWVEICKTLAITNVRQFALNDSADVHANYHVVDGKTQMQIALDKQSFSVRMQTLGEHNVKNALAASACCYAAGVSPSSIQRGLENFLPVNGRLQTKMGLKNIVVLDDTYNANPDSVRAAIDVLSQVDGVKILVLGDMGEVGDEGASFHQEIGQYAAHKNIDYFYTLGELAFHADVGFSQNQSAHHQHFSCIDELIAFLKKTVPAKSTILIKGSRFMKMERVVAALLDNNQSNEKY